MIEIYNTYVEKETSEERINCIVECPEHIYIFEFKLKGNADKALQQINKRGYAAPYLTDKHTIHKVGINFSSEKGTIDGWREES